MRFLVDDAEPPDAQFTTRGISWSTTLEAGDEHRIAISYRADGANTFAYGLQHNQRTDVDVTVTVLDLRGSEVPKTSLPPTASEAADDDETFTWKYEGLIADRDIQLSLPTRLSFAQRITQLQGDFHALAQLAPFMVGLFLASLAGVLHLSRRRLGLESYLLAGLGMALFYPTLTFLSGALGVILASALALTIVSGMLLVFLSRTAGHGTWWHVALLLLIYLGFLSLGMLTPWRGLLASGGGLLLVGTFMLLYAQRPPLPEPEPIPEADEVTVEPASAPPSEETIPQLASLYCLTCGRALADDHSFCPGCGHDTSRFVSCAHCGHRHYVPDEPEPVHCIHCGHLLD